MAHLAKRISLTPNFFIVLTFATLGPLILIPISISTGVNTYFNSMSLLALSILVGSGHVAATLYFFFDIDARKIIKSDHTRLITFPLMLAIAFSLILNFSGNQSILILETINYIFLFYHYQKQNFGIISLINHGIPKNSRTLLNCALFFPVVASVMVFAPTILQQISFSITSIKFVATFLYLCGAFFSLVFIIRFIRQLKQLTLIIILASTIFFLPLWLFPENRNASFGAFASAHGIQYLVIMGYTASGAKKIILKLAFISAVLMGAIFLEGFAQVSLLGVTVGLTWGHFLIDARIWKMSIPDSRAYVTSRLKFAILK